MGRASGPAQALRASVVDSERAWDRLGAAWTALFDRLELLTPFQSLAWSRSWWAVFGEDMRLCLVVLEQHGQVAGIVPLAVRPRPLAPGEEIVFVGVGPSDYLDWLLGGEDPPRAVDAVLTALAEVGVAWLNLTDIPAHSSLLPALRQVLGPEHSGRMLREHQPCPRVDLPRIWDYYVAGRSSGLRVDIRKADAHATERGIGPLELLRDQASLGEALPAFLATHLSWWARRPTESVLADQQMWELLRTAVPALSDAGLAEMTLRRRDERLVSASLILRRGQRRYAYQFAHDVTLGGLSPGIGHMAATLRHAVTEGATSMDLMRGAEPYKLRWATSMHWTSRLYGTLT